MARLAPIILALMVNCCGIFVFRNARNVLYAPYTVRLARHIFTIGNYFLLLSTKLYPPSFRSIHWTARNIFEFLVGMYLLETILCDFWFPLECFAQTHLQILPALIKKFGPKSGRLCCLLCHFTRLAQHPKAPVILSLGLSSFLTLVLMHGTRAIDLGIIRNCGLKMFTLHIKDQIINGIKKLGRPCYDESVRTPEPNLNHSSR